MLAIDFSLLSPNLQQKIGIIYTDLLFLHFFFYFSASSKFAAKLTVFRCSKFAANLTVFFFFFFFFFCCSKFSANLAELRKTKKLEYTCIYCLPGMHT